MNLSAPFIHRPVMTTFLILALLLGGVYAFFSLPTTDLPTIEYPHIQVRAGYSGANPETVLNQITIPLEKELTLVKGIQEMSSTSSSGFSVISLRFDLEKDMNIAIRDVQAALNRAQSHLPKELDTKPTYELQEDGQEPILWFLLTTDQGTVGELRQYADTFILPRLNRIEGVAQIKIYGAEKSIWLRLNPDLMAARHVGFNEVIDTVRQHTAMTPLGTIQTSSKRLSLEWPGDIHEAKDIENLRIGDSAVRIKEIGEVSDKAEQEKEFHFVTHTSVTRPLILGIQKVNDGNTVAISNAVNKVLEEVKKELPPSMHLDLWFDKSVWIKESLFDVQISILLAFLLVILVIYFSLGRLSEALITCMALPLSLLGTFIAMYFAHFSLDLLSLLALTLSVGFVVDDAIVVLENIVRYQEKGHSAKEASLIGSKQISFTILSMTLSLVAVFLPLLFMSGINGRLFREFSITLAVAIIVSGLVSLSVTPMLCSRFLTVSHTKNKLQCVIDGAYAWMIKKYGGSLKRCLAFKKTTLSTAILCMCATVFLFFRLPVNLIPPEDRGFFFAFVNLPTGLSPAEFTVQQKKLDELIRQHPHIEKFLSLNFENSLVYLASLAPLSKRPPQQEIIDEIQNIIDTVPGTQTFIQPYQLLNLDLDLGNAGQYEYVVRGLEFSEIEKAVINLTKELQSHQEVTFVQNSLKNDSPMLELKINEELLHQYGLNKHKIQELLQNAFSQKSVGSIQKGAHQEKIYMELLSHFQNHMTAPDKLYLKTSNEHLIPLRAIAQWQEKLGSPQLVRREQLPAVTLRFSLSNEISPNKGLEKVENIAKQILPTNVKGNLAGSAKAISSTIRNTLFLLLAAAVVMYVVLGVLYESFIHPFTILSSIPFAGLGGALTLFLFGESISIFSAVGFLLLIGIVKKNGIMMVDYALDAQRQGSDPHDAIYNACLIRFRPIMMTTIAAIMGALPIAIGFGDGAEMRQGLGLVIVGGLLFSQVLTLYVTPAIYLLFEKNRKGG